jgi:hypothetical protein
MSCVENLDCCCSLDVTSLLHYTQNLKHILIHRCSLYSFFQHSLDSRGEARAIQWSRSSSFDQESIADGLLPREFSVKGFYVDPAIVPGFKYVVRLADSDKLLFNVSELKIFSDSISLNSKLICYQIMLRFDSGQNISFVLLSVYYFE